MMEIAYYDGQFVNINEKIVAIQDRGHQFGDGIYEVVRIYNGKPFLLDEHLDRLEQSASSIHLALEYTREKLKDLIYEGIKRSGLKEAEVYIQITRGVAPRHHLYPKNTSPMLSMAVKPPRVIPNEKRKHGIKVILQDDERWANCYIKSLNLLPNVMAKQKAFENGADEAILLRKSWITEGSSSNVFAIKHGTLYTPPATKRILNGITRMAIIKIAENLGIPYQEVEITSGFLIHAEEVFITSTSIELLPVVQVDDSVIGDGKPGPISKQLLNAYKNLYDE
jgi:D-alanine transaminase